MTRWFSVLLVTAILTGCVSTPKEHVSGFVSLHPAMTETLFALGAGDQLIGRSDYCTTPDAALPLPTFGTALTPEIEALANLKPTSVLLDASYGAKVDLIRGVAPVTSLPWLTKEDVVSSTLKIGALMGTQKRAQEWADTYKQFLWSTPEPNAPSAVLLLGNGEITHKTLWYIKPDSLHGAALASAGFRNIVPTGIKGPPSMSIEQLIAYDPDVLLILSTEANSHTIETSLGQIKPLKAIQNHRLRVIEGKQVMSNGPGIIDLIQRLKTAYVDVTAPQKPGH